MERSERPRSPNALSDFREVLEQVEKHAIERYFVLKSIVLNNLYGVDIMQEAVEICKLRLFLKLVAQLETYDQIEPLPDIDFNRAIRQHPGGIHLPGCCPSGNDDYAQWPASASVPRRTQADLDRINEAAAIASRAFDQFREQQTVLGGEVTSADKLALRDRLHSLGDVLDRYLATDYGIDPENATAYKDWRDSHQPFHWFVEFYALMSTGGFDVVIGNPPYVEYSKIRKEYQIQGFQTEQCGNLYALCTERSVDLLGSGTRLGFIVQAPIVSTKRMSHLRELLHRNSELTAYATFNDRPSKLFQGMNNCRVCIVTHSKRVSKDPPTTVTTRYHKWYKEEASSLLELVNYQSVPVSNPSDVIPKLRSKTDLAIYRRVRSQPEILGSLISARPTDHSIYYKNNRREPLVHFHHVSASILEGWG